MDEVASSVCMEARTKPLEIQEAEGQWGKE